MMARMLSMLSDNDLVKLLQEGGVGVLPTDTLYGLVAIASNRTAVERLYHLKHRQHQPGTIVAADVNQLVDLGLKARYLKGVEQYWPAPLSIIIPCSMDLAYLHLGTFGLAVRIPADKRLTALLKQTGPLLTTSANPSNKPPATSISEAKKYFGDKVDFYVDGGDLSQHLPSTIIRIIDDAIEIIREGAVRIDENGRLL